MSKGRRDVAGREAVPYRVASVGIPGGSPQLPGEPIGSYAWSEKRPGHARAMSEVWVVGKPNEEGWEIQGVYSSEALAKKNCKSGWFIGPVEVDTPLPEEEAEWVGAYWP